MRIGHGFDVHAFGGVGPIIIGGGFGGAYLCQLQRQQHPHRL